MAFVFTEEWYEESMELDLLYKDPIRIYRPIELMKISPLKHLRCWNLLKHLKLLKSIRLCTAIGQKMETPGYFRQIYFNVVIWLQSSREIQFSAAAFLQFLRKLGSWDGHWA